MNSSHAPDPKLKLFKTNPTYSDSYEKENEIPCICMRCIPFFLVTLGSTLEKKKKKTLHNVLTYCILRA